jgi:hypothetical protein
MAAIQVLKGTSVTITETFSVDGSPIDLDSGVPAVTAKFPDGTALTPAPVASGSWTGRTTGQYRIVLDAQPEVTILDPITWIGTIGGKQQTLYSRVEWIGALLFNLADLRAVKVAGGTPFALTTDYPNQLLLDRRAEVTDDFEARCGWSFVPRFARQTLDGNGRCDLLVDHLKCSKLLSVIVNGIAQPVGNYTLDRSGILRATSNYMASGWFQPGVGNVIVEYVHGWDRPPAAILSAALARTAMLLLPSQAGSTVNTWTTPDGVTYSYSQAGQSLSGGGIRHFGVPDIDAVLNEPAYSATGMAFA